MSTLGPNESAQLLTNLLKIPMPFFFARVGDGAIECLRGAGRAEHTCDGEKYSPALAEAVHAAIIGLRSCVNRPVMWGDWRTAVKGSAPTYVDEWCKLIEPDHKFLLDYEALLLNRISPSLVAFYGTLQRSAQRKLYIGHHPAACRLLGADAFLETPMSLHVRDRDAILRRLDLECPDVVLFGAGMAGFAAVAEWWVRNQGVIAIHLGSALDPLYSLRPTRGGQLSSAAACALLQELL